MGKKIAKDYGDLVEVSDGGKVEARLMPTGKSEDALKAKGYEVTGKWSSKGRDGARTAEVRKR